MNQSSRLYILLMMQILALFNPLRVGLATIAWRGRQPPSQVSKLLCYIYCASEIPHLGGQGGIFKAHPQRVNDTKST